MSKKLTKSDSLKIAQDTIFALNADQKLVSDRIISLAHDDYYWPLIEKLQTNLSIAVALLKPQEPVADIRVPTGAKVRHNSPQTSWEAAYEQTPEKSQKLYRAIYRVLTIRGNMNDHELHLALEKAGFPHTVSGMRTRRKELVTAGWVTGTPEKRPSENDMPSIVWTAVKEKYVAP